MIIQVIIVYLWTSSFKIQYDKSKSDGNIWLVKFGSQDRISIGTKSEPCMTGHLAPGLSASLGPPFTLLTLRGLVGYKCIDERCQHCFVQWLVICFSASHCPNQCWLIPGIRLLEWVDMVFQVKFKSIFQYKTLTNYLCDHVLNNDFALQTSQQKLEIMLIISNQHRFRWWLGAIRQQALL